MAKRKQTGFTLLELMIVIQIISVMAAIALPNMMRMRIQSNQAAAVGNLSAVSKAQVAFANAERGYATTWKALRDDPIAKGQPAYLNQDFGVATVSGYTYTIAGVGDAIQTSSGVEGTISFNAWADPSNAGSLGAPIYHYFVDASGVIRYDKDAQADDTSKLI